MSLKSSRKKNYIIIVAVIVLIILFLKIAGFFELKDLPQKNSYKVESGPQEIENSFFAKENKEVREGSDKFDKDTRKKQTAQTLQRQIVLFEKEPVIEDAAGVIIANPELKGLKIGSNVELLNEFENLKDLRATSYDDFPVIGKTNDGYDIVEIDSSLKSDLLIYNYYEDKDSSIRFLLKFDGDSGDLSGGSCLSIKNEIFYFGDSANFFQARFDGHNYLAFLTSSKLYLRLKFKQSEMIGVLYGFTNNGWQELAQFNAIGRSASKGKLNLHECSISF